MAKVSNNKKRLTTKIIYKNPLLLNMLGISVIAIVVYFAIFNLHKMATKLRFNNIKPRLSSSDYQYYWSEFVNDHPTYLDGHIELARVKKVLGKDTEALETLDNALKLYPNSQKLKYSLEEMLD